MESMKIFLTEFQHRGKVMTGPILYANSFEEAQEAADEYGLEVVGELTDVYIPPSDFSGERTLH